MYSFGNLFKQEPAIVTAAIMAILTVLTLSGAFGDSDNVHEIMLGVETGLTLILGLFYVRPLTVSKDALNEWDEAVNGPGGG